MAATTIATADELVVLRCWCGISHAVPQSLRKEQLRKHHGGETPMGIYCPLGHSHVPSGEPKYKAMEQELQRERQQHDQTRQELSLTKKRADEQAKKSAREHRRIGNGVCPCCNRTFQNLGRHMNHKHPEFKGK